MEFLDAAQRWDTRYQQSDRPLFGSQPNAWLQQHSHRLDPESSVLCIADGQGRNGLHLAALGHQVFAFDISEVAVDATRARARDLSLAICAQVSRLDDWSWDDNQYDAIVMVFTQFASPSSRRELIVKIGRSLRAGGVLVIEGFGTRQIRYETGGPGVAENLYDASFLAHSFPQWQVLASRDCDVMLAEGTGHQGRAHVVSAVLRR